MRFHWKNAASLMHFTLKKSSPANAQVQSHARTVLRQVVSTPESIRDSYFRLILKNTAATLPGFMLKMFAFCRYLAALYATYMRVSTSSSSFIPPIQPERIDRNLSM